jgi:hypothetical protein
MRTLLSLAASFALVVAIQPAHAQTGGAKQTDYFESKEADGSSVIFKDDPMKAQGLDANGATLQMRGRPIRTLLIRPRLQFLQELTKSVESL